VTGSVISGAWPSPASSTLDLRLEGPDVRGLSDADVWRLFPGRTTGARLNRLRNWPRVVVRSGEVIVGVATYTHTPLETHVPDFAADVPRSIRATHANVAGQVLDSLLGALETATRDAGCGRLVVIPSTNSADLGRRGYVCVSEGCGGSWMEKALP
jgi:hypothetical protein